MAFDIKKFVEENSASSSGFNPEEFAASLGYGKPDLSTSSGLLSIAEKTGGSVATAAEKIANPEQGFLGKVGSTIKGGLLKALDILQRPNFAIATGVKNVLDVNPQTTLIGGLESGITGQTKNTFSDVFSEVGINPTSMPSKIAKGIGGFALDVLLDPTTYITLGAGAGIKVGEEVLSKAGTELLAKGIAQKAGQEFGADFVKNAILNLAKSSPELYAKYIDQGGIKFFGNTLISGGRIAAVARALPYASKMDEITQPFRNTLYALFNRDASAKFGKLPQEYIDLQQKFRDLGYSRSQNAIKETLDIARANSLTVPEAELITNAIEAKLPLADARLENARKLMEKSLGRNLKNEQRAGIAVGELPNYVPHLLVDTNVKNIPFKPGFIPEGVRVGLGASKERTIGKIVTEEGLQIGKGDIIEQATIKEINDAFGKEFFDPNVVRAVAVRSLASERAVTASEFLREVASKFGAAIEHAPSNYVEVGAKELAGFKFHPGIAEAIDGFKKSFINDEPTNALLQQFDKLQNLFKASVTQLFPAFHGRNAFSNVFLNFLNMGADSINPIKHAIATNLLNKERIVSTLERSAKGVGEQADNAKIMLKELLNQPILKDDFGKSWNFGELRNVIKDNRVAFSNDFVNSADLQSTILKELEQTNALGKAQKVGQALNPFSTENIAFKAGRAVGGTIEQQARLVNFVTNLQKTGDVITSANRVKQFLFDYQNLSSFEKNIMRRLIPFYTFTRKNMELQLTQLFKQPGKYAGQAKLFSTVSELMSGAKLTDEEQNKLPDFIKQGLGLIVKREGDNLQIVNSLGTPLEQIFSAVQKNNFLGSISPAIAVPLQIAIGQNLFYEKPLADVNDAAAFQNAPQFIKDYIGFTTRINKDGTERYIALNTTRLFIINSLPPGTRILSSIRQLEQNNVSGKLKILQQLTGIKPYSVNLEQAAASQEKTKFRALQDLLERTGVAPVIKKSFIPKAIPSI